jgi:hypothetical protein
MKIIVSFFIILITGSIFAQKTEDIEAIKSMCGCFEIKFNFKETFSYPKDSANYIASEEKHETALEWAELIEDQPGKISIQHLLIVRPGVIVKHWRQDWLYENNTLFDYNGFQDWKFKQLPKESVKGQWTQKVYEVDDKPRYEGTATWIHVDGRHFWENLASAPLPRREYTQRNDYNITKRWNQIEIIHKGWIHNQDNDKIIRDIHGNDYLLAQEKGYNTYTKMNDNVCQAAQVWWQENQEFWKKVRLKWDLIFAQNQDLIIKEVHDSKPLYRHLQSLKNDASLEKINKIIESFLESPHK